MSLEDCNIDDLPDRESFGEAEPTRVMTFRSFEVMPSARRLLRDKCEVEIGGRAFDLLVVLLQARGRVVDRDVIVQRVWPSTTVAESNLRFQMARLRKVLGPDRDLIKNVAGRGYMLAEEVPTSYPLAFAPPALVGVSHPDNLPPQRSQHPTQEQMRALMAENHELRQALASIAIRVMAHLPEGMAKAS